MRLDRPDDDGIERAGARPEPSDLGVGRRPGDDDVVDRGEPRPERAAETGRDHRRRVGRGQVGGLGHDRQDPRRRREGDRRRLAAVGRPVGPGQGPFGQLARDGEVLIRADHVEIGLRFRAGEPAAELGETSARGGQVGRVEQVTCRGGDQRRLDPSARGGVGGRQQQVVAGTDRGDHLDRLGGALCERAHVERIADRDPAKAELVAERAAHHGASQGRRQRRVAGQRGHRDMGRHGEPGPGRDRRPERDELVRLERLAVAADHGQLVMGVLVDGAQPREVLDRGGHPGRLEPADHRRAQPPDLGRVVAERADPHRRVAGLAGQVEDRGVDHVDAHRPRLAPDRPADPLDEVLVADRAERHVAGERGGRLAERHQLAGLLVGGDEQRAGHGRATRRRVPDSAATRGPDLARPLERRAELADLPRRPDVERHEQRDPGHGRVGQPALDPAWHRLALEGEHHPFEDAGVGHPFTAPARPRTK